MPAGIHATAKKVIETNSAHHRAKTYRLRALRLAKVAKVEGVDAMPRIPRCNSIDQQNYLSAQEEAMNLVRKT